LESVTEEMKILSGAMRSVEETSAHHTDEHWPDQPKLILIENTNKDKND
jgi:hypothetical protein